MIFFYRNLKVSLITQVICQKFVRFLKGLFVKFYLNGDTAVFVPVTRLSISGEALYRIIMMRTQENSVITNS